MFRFTSLSGKVKNRLPLFTCLLDIQNLATRQVFQLTLLTWRTKSRNLLMSTWLGCFRNEHLKKQKDDPKDAPMWSISPPWFFYRKTLAAKTHSITWGRGIPHPPNWTDRVCIWGWYDPLQLFKSKTSDSQVSKWTGPERWHRTSW